jgi:FHS family L-fucose permease-like MFS transporter
MAKHSYREGAIQSRESEDLSVSSEPIAEGSHADPSQAPLIPKGRLIPFLVVTPLFFLWAIPNNLTDILIRQFMKSFELNASGAAQLQLGIFIGYFAMALPAGEMMRRFGYKAGLMTGLMLMGFGCWMFWPAAKMGHYAYFVAAQFVIGCGLSCLETGANPFIAQLGPVDSSERRLNLSQAFNPLGSITAGLVGTVFIFSGVEFSGSELSAQRTAGTLESYLHAETMRVVPTYLVLGTVAILWAIMVALTKFPDLGTGEPHHHASKSEHVSLFQRHFVMAVLAQFLYVGAQVGTWSYFILYVRGATGLGDKAAGYMLTGTLAAFAVGRFSSAWIMKHLSARSMLMVYAAANVVLGLVGVALPNWVGVICILATSFFMSIMFPTIFAMGLKGMGDKTKTAGSVLVMAILGGAALTKVMGVLRDASGLQAAYVVPVVCFACVGIYAWLWSENRNTKVTGAEV